MLLLVPHVEQIDINLAQPVFLHAPQAITPTLKEFARIVTLNARPGPRQPFANLVRD